MKTLMTLSFCIAIGLLASIALAQTGSEERITAITIPSADITLSFLQPGRIDGIQRIDFLISGNRFHDIAFKIEDGIIVSTR